MATGKSGTLTWTGSTKTFSVRVNWSETYDPIKNESVVTITSVQAKSTNWYGFTYYPDGIIKINGTVIATMNARLGTHNVGIWSQGSWNNIKASGGVAVSGSVTVPHGSDGKKTIAITLTGNEYSGCRFLTVSGDGGSNWYVQGDQNIDLTDIDRSAPTVSCATTVNSTSGMTIKATASVLCNKWEYSIDGGSTWTEYSTTEGTTAIKTLTGLTSDVYSVKVRARKSSNYVVGTSDSASTDLVASTVTLTVSSITASSVYISASSNVNCNIWQYSIDDGKTWTQFSTTNGTSATKTISNLTPNTSYKIKVRARKKSNNLYGTSAVKTVKTLGGTVINSVSDLTVDVAAPVLSLNWTVYDANYTHTLTIKNGDTVVLTVTGIKGSVGTNNKTYSLTQTDRADILDAMASLSSFNATFVISTYSGNTQIGTDSSLKATIKTTAANSAPRHGGFSYSDVNTTTVGITGNSALVVQGKSSLRVVFNGGTAKNGATIKSYKVTIGSKEASSTGTTVDFGTVPVSGDVTLTATVTDSRGWTATQTITLPVIEFTGVSINSWAARRVNEVEEMSQLELVGTLSPVYVDDVACNALQSLRYRYKKVTATSWSQYYDVSGVEKEDDRFIVDNDAFASFDPEYSWDIQIQAADKLSTYTITLVLPKGTPLVAYRSKKVGINNGNPQSALDVNGEIMQNGYVVMGFVSVLDEYTTFNNVKGSGIYWYNSSTAISNAPATEDGFLEVMCFGTAIMHRFTGVSGTVKRRVFRTSWSAWS